MPPGDPLANRVANLAERVQAHDEAILDAQRERGRLEARVARLEERRAAVDEALTDIRTGISAMRNDVALMHRQNLEQREKDREAFANALQAMAGRVDHAIMSTAKAEATAEATQRSAKVVLRYAWSAFIGIATPAALFGAAMLIIRVMWEVGVGFWKWLFGPVGG